MSLTSSVAVHASTSAAVSAAVAALVLGLCAVHALASTRGHVALLMWSAASAAWLLGLSGAAGPEFIGNGMLVSAAAPVLAAMAAWRAVSLLLPRIARQSSSRRAGLRPLALIAISGFAPTIGFGALCASSASAMAMLATAGCLGVEARRVSDRQLRGWMLAKLVLLILGAAGLVLFRPGDSGASDVTTLALGSIWILVLTGLFLGLHRISERRALIRHASRDELTGLNRRGALMDHLAGLELGPDEPVAVIMLDVDHFKGVNDRHGHPAGDAVLAHLGALIRECVRDEDLAARFGGEEFCVVLPGAGLASARAVAQRLVASTRSACVRAPGAGTLRFTISAGYAVGRMADLDAGFRQADSALYAAKGKGRDRAVGFERVAPPVPS